MSNSYSLDDLRNDLDREFAPLELTVGKTRVVLRNPLRLSSADRKVVLDAMKALDDDSLKEDDVDAMLDEIRKVLGACADAGKGDALISAIGDDVALAMKIMSLWSEATQPGEASNSPA